jgi:putative transposase
VSLLHAHLVFVTTYRQTVFTNAMLTYCENTMREVCAELNAELVKSNEETDHVHLLVSSPPTLANSTLIQPITGRTAYTVPREYTAAGVRARTRRHLWSPSYVAVPSAGAPPSTVKQYIDGQARPL